MTDPAIGKRVLPTVESPAVFVDPVLAFNLSDLQLEAAKSFAYSPGKTLEVALALYEKGLISYPRTDFRHLPSSNFAGAQRIVRERKSLLQEAAVNADVKGLVWDDSKLDIHHGIIPTDISVAALFGLALSEEETNVYRLVHKRFFQLFSTESATDKP